MVELEISDRGARKDIAGSHDCGHKGPQRRPRSRMVCVRKPRSCSRWAGAKPWGGLCQVLDGIFPSPPEHSPPSSAMLPALGHWPVQTASRASLILGRQQNVVLASPQVLPVTGWTLSPWNPHVEALTHKATVLGDRALKYITNVQWVHKGPNPAGLVSLEEEEMREIALRLYTCPQRRGHVKTERRWLSVSQEEGLTEANPDSTWILDF